MNRRQQILFAAAFALMALAAGLILHMKARQRLGNPGVRVAQSTDNAGPYVDLPRRVLSYDSTESDLTVEKGTLPKDTTFGKRLYQDTDGFQILMTTVLMGTDRTSIHRPEFCLNGQGWTINTAETRITTVAVEKPHPYQLQVKIAMTTKVVKGAAGQPISRRGIYVYWFVADGAITARDTDRMWSMGSELIRTGVLQRWAYISCFAVCEPGQEEVTFKRMQTFIGAAVPQFQLSTGDAQAPAVQTALRQ